MIKKEDNIAQVLSEHPEAIKVFIEFGIHCVGCAAASFETIEQGAQAHGIPVDKLVEAVNKAIEGKE